MRRTSIFLIFALMLIASLSTVGCGGDESTSADGDGGQTAAAGSESSDASTDGEGAEADGSESGDDGSEGSLTKAAFVKQADAICTAAVKTTMRELKTGNDLRGGIVSVLTTEADQVEELPVPAGEGGAVEAMLVSVRQAIDAFEDGAKQDAENANQLVLKAEKLAGAYGLKACWISSAS